MQEWTRNDREYHNNRFVNYYRKNPEKMRDRLRGIRAKTKLSSQRIIRERRLFVSTLTGYTKDRLQTGCLTLDHIDSKGALHRRELKISGGTLHSWIKLHDFPKGFQVLCMNCQFVKKIEKKEDPYSPTIAV